MTRPIIPDATDQSVTLYFVDSTTGLPKTGLTDASAGLALWYRRQLGAKTAITPAALAALTTAHTDGGFEEIADGAYRVDLPDAAVAASSDDVTVGGSATGAIAIPITHPLNFITQANIQSEAEDALIAHGLDHLVGASVTGTDIANDSIIAQLVSKSGTADWDDYDNTTDSLQANRDNIGTAGAALTEAGGTGDHLTAITNQTDNLPTDPADQSLVIAATDALAALLATAQADLDTLTGADGVTLATSQPNYAPNTVVPDAAGTAPTAAENAAAVLAATVVGSKTVANLLRGFASAMLAKKSGEGTASIVFRDTEDSKDVITATVDASGNRTVVSLDLS